MATAGDTAMADATATDTAMAERPQPIPSIFDVKHIPKAGRRATKKKSADADLGPYCILCNKRHQTACSQAQLRRMSKRAANQLYVIRQQARNPGRWTWHVAKKAGKGLACPLSAEVLSDLVELHERMLEVRQRVVGEDEADRIVSAVEIGELAAKAKHVENYDMRREEGRKARAEVREARELRRRERERMQGRSEREEKERKEEKRERKRERMRWKREMADSRREESGVEEMAKEALTMMESGGRPRESNQSMREKLGLKPVEKRDEDIDELTAKFAEEFDFNDPESRPPWRMLEKMGL